MRLVVITGPIGAGKSTVADLLSRRLTGPVAVVDVDDVAATIAGGRSAESGLWPAAHRVHGAAVAAWLRNGVDVLAVGPIYDEAEQGALLDPLPLDTELLWAVIDAPVEVTLARVADDPTRGVSKEPEFHRASHDRFRALVGGIPPGPRYDAARLRADEIAEDLAGRVERMDR